MKKLNIAYLGIRANELGGHDKLSPERVLLRNNIAAILQEYSYVYKLHGITSLATGGEQEFAQVCLDLNIQYSVYLPYADQEDNFAKAVDIQKRYEALLDAASYVEHIKQGNYSPKKVNRKNLKLATEADILLFQPSKYKEQYEIIGHCLKHHKTLFILRSF